MHVYCWRGRSHCDERSTVSVVFAATYFVRAGFLPLVSAIAVAHRRVLLHRHRVRELGFGDITAMLRRLASWVTGRMVAGIVIVGIGASIIVDAIKQGRRQQPTQGGDAGPNANGPPE
jgi:hypothetical protein